jgi:hypothetical protein
VRRAAAGGLEDLGAAIVHALRADDVDPIRVDPAVVGHDAGADHADAWIGGKERG